MDKATAYQIFREQIKKYIEFDAEEWELFTNHVSLSNLKKKKHFIEPGMVCNSISFIVAGSVRYYHIKDGEEITGYFCFENEFVSSYKSFLTRLPTLNYIQALEDTFLVNISYADMQKMLADPKLSHKIDRFGRLVAEYYLICYEDRMQSFITQTPEERYLQLLNTGGDIIRRMPQHYIAHFLGVTPVSLSRISRRVLKVA